MERTELALALTLKAIDKGDYTLSDANTNEDIANIYAALFNRIFESLNANII